MSWAEWTRLAGDIFAMTDRRDDSVLAAWSRVLAGQGTTPQEAADAVRWLANDPPAFRQSVLPAIQNRLRAAQNEKAARGSSEAQNAPRCILCDSTGRVFAACPQAYEAGRYKEVALYCRCPCGLVMRSALEAHLHERRPDVKVWTVDGYDSAVEWVDTSTGEVCYGPEARKRMLAEMRRRLGVEMWADGAARKADRAMGRLPSVFAAAMRKNNIRGG